MEKIEYKFILIGNSGVGKTSILRFLSTGEFPEDTISTIGVDKKTLNVSFEVEEKNTKIKKDFIISLFDTAGQEKFRAIARNYYKGSDGILLLYDITNRKSFENIEIWIDSITESLGKKGDSKYVIILIGNKLDLVTEGKEERKVSEEEAEEICQKNKMIWGGERSIKSLKFDELKKLFDGYVKDVYNEIGEKFGKEQKTKKIDKYKKKSTCCIAQPI